MSSYRTPLDKGPPGHSYRPYPPPNRSDFYDDRRPRSRSPDRRYSSPHRRRSSPQDISRPRGPATDERHNNYDDKEWSRSQDSGHSRNNPRLERPSLSPRRGRGAYRDRDHESYKSPSYNSRSRSRSSDSREGRPPSREKPSKEIMMEGLAAHLTEDDISAELKQHYHVEGLDDVRVIRDRQTKQSRQFGFLRFATLQDSEIFMERNYPIVYLYGDSTQSRGNPDDAKVRIAYGRERKDANRSSDDADWICTVCNINNYSTRIRCFRCQAFKSDMATTVPMKAANVGDNDASPDNTPSQFLLLRGLELSVTEELLAKGVAKLFKPSVPSAHPNQPSKKGGKVASTTGDSNLGAKEGTLRRVLLIRDRHTNDSWRFGFAEFATIEDAQAALIRFNSFDRFTIASKQVMVSYIHAGVFVPVLKPGSSSDRFTFSPLSNPSLKLQYWDEDAYVAEFIVSTGEPAPAGKASKFSAATSAEKEGFKSAKEAEKTKKRKADIATAGTATKKVTASHLQFWSNRHAELHGLGHKNSSEDQIDQNSSNSPVDAPPSQSYADPNRHCCYLCSRQFGSSAEVNKHERLSELHRTNLKNETLVKNAQAKLEKHGIQPPQPGMEYRDRARERRKIYGVVNKKGEQVGNGPKAAKAVSDDEDVPVQSKGASLLSKMGYTVGQGLGASGEGRMAPIDQDIYAAGVGLGAQGGKLGDAVSEAERNTKGDYSGFAQRTKEGARERYSRL